MHASVIISTYNKPEWLRKVLVGYACQKNTDFEVIVADDGSGDETKSVIQSISEQTHLKIKHVWHPDDGFQKTRILNKAILASSTDYLIFTDGDCIPRQDFVQSHLKHREPGKFLSGGHFPLTMEISELINDADIKSQNCFDLNWLKSKGLKSNFKNIKLSKNKGITQVMNFITPTKATWNGGNASAWKKDILSANGFDERMKYGGEDREFGERLENAGVEAKRIRYFAIVVHLEHERGYVTEEAWRKNDEIRSETKANQKSKTEFGLNLHDPVKS